MVDNELLLAEQKYKRTKVIKIIVIVFAIIFCAIDLICMVFLGVRDVRTLAVSIPLFIIISTIPIFVSVIRHKKYQTCKRSRICLPENIKNI